MAQRLRAFIIEEALSLKEAAQDVAKSGAYLYPFKGILYFSYHADLWRPLLSRASQIITLGIGVTSTMFFFTYVPQLAVMAFTSGPLAPISAALLVLSESSTITTFLATSSLETGLIDTFDGTLIAAGNEALVAEGRQLKPGAGNDHIARLGKMIKAPMARLRPKSIIRSLVYLPLNFIPLVGTLVYVVVQGKSRGPAAHERYFQLKGWNATKREEWVAKNRAAYTGLGVASFVFEMVPFASIVFSFTNTAGAALWAADIEKATK